MADIDNDDETDTQNEEVNATPITSLKDRVCRSMEKTYKASFEAATVDGEWAAITQALNPSAALEIYCIKKTDPTLTTKEAVIVMLKKVKRHLIRLNLTVLVAFEKRMLLDSINAIKYREEHFNEWTCNHQPQGGEDGWQDRMAAAQAKLDSIAHEDEHKEAV